MNTCSVSSKCVVTRWSRRLIAKKEDKVKNNIVMQASLGYLELLPKELQYTLLSHITVKDLGIMAICSRSLRNLVIDFAFSSYGIKHLSLAWIKEAIMFQDMNFTAELRNVRNLGLFFKRVTLLLPTQRRIGVIHNALRKMKCTCDENFNSGSTYLECFGLFAQTIIAGWLEPECLQAHASLENASEICKKLKTVLLACPGTLPDEERCIRRYYRSVYLNYCRYPSDCCFWITVLLKPFPYVFQAKILYILYGPVYADGTIDWNFPVTFSPYEPNPSNPMRELAAIVQLLSTYKNWSHSDIMGLLEEIKDTPRKWLTEHTAYFLLQCGEDVSVLFMSNYLSNGKFVDLSFLIASLLMVCKKYQLNMNFVIDIIQKVCASTENDTDRKKLINIFPAIFAEMVFDPTDVGSELENLKEAFKYFICAIAMKTFNLPSVTERLQQNEE